MVSTPSYKLHSATNQEQKEGIYRFRFDVFGREMGLLGPLENWAEPSFSDPADDHSHHIFAESGGEIVGSIRITSGQYCAESDEYDETYKLKPFLDEFRADQIAVVTRLMVNASYRGSALSLHLVKVTAEYCLKEGIECVFIDCQPHLVPLYQRYGFRSYRTVFNDPYVGILVPLVFVFSDLDHLAEVRSPFYKMVKKQRQPDPEKLRAVSKLISSAPSIVTEELQGDEFFQDILTQHLDIVGDDQEEDWSVLEGLYEQVVTQFTDDRR